MISGVPVRLSGEQQEAIAAVGRVRRLKVYALAGTGKTATLKAIAARHPRRRMLYLAFNRAIAEEAKAQFPANVEVRTVHSLAYAQVGRHYRARLSRLDCHAIAQALGMPVGAVFERIGRFQDFLNSDCPLRRSAILTFLSKSAQKKSFSTESGDANSIDWFCGRQAVAEDWEAAADFILRLYGALKTGPLPVDHSFYLKEFQLNFQEFGLADAYDVVLLDEGQDVNRVMLSIFEQFRGRLVMVGDRHQKIYGFRGAINALEEFQAEEIVHLTRTFRFAGQEQVRAVNDLLFYLKCEDNLLRPASGVSGRPGGAASCLITRTNAKLIEHLMADPGLKTVRPPEQYFDRFFQIFDRKIRLAGVGPRSFPDYLGALDDLAATMGDTELAACVKLIRRHNGDREMFQRLYDRARRNYENGGARWVGTAHSVKGLEFDRVRLAEDFRAPRELLERLLQEKPALGRLFRDGSRPSMRIPRDRLRQVFGKLNDDLLKEEINLLYVALTRARKEVAIPKKYLLATEYRVEAG